MSILSTVKKRARFVENSIDLSRILSSKAILPLVVKPVQNRWHREVSSVSAKAALSPSTARKNDLKHPELLVKRINAELSTIALNPSSHIFLDLKRVFRHVR